jgi:uncharacterized protein (TIGR02145 family)
VKSLVPTNGDSLVVKLVASYIPEGGGTTTKYAYFEIRVEDGFCICPAKKSATEWIVFQCHNLGGEDIITSAQLIDLSHHGDWYRWGALTASLPNKSTTPTDAITTTNWSAAWTSSSTPDFPFQESGDTWTYDPCPAGWKLPTIAEWTGVKDNNGAWTARPDDSWSTNETTNFTQIGDYLFLPAAGYRLTYDGRLANRGSNGYYWSSSASSGNAQRVNFDSSVRSVVSINGGNGYAARCAFGE